jgi:hypothetical protein
MKRAGIFFILIFATGFTVQAGTTFGLGAAVAEHDAEVITQERARALTLDLPVCTEEPYTVSPIDLATTFNLEPLGHMSGVGGHMFPTDHIYFYVVKSTPSTPTTNVYSPGNIGIYQVASSEYLHASPPFTDYTIRFYHINELSPALQTAIGPINEYCSTYTDGSIYYCTKSVAIYVNAGDLLGSITGRAGSSFYTLDLGAYDRNKPALGFISPARQYTDASSTRCPLDAYQDPIKSQLEARLGAYDGSQRRTAAPICGEFMQDVPNTAQGLWYVPGTPQNTVQDISPHLALVHDNVTPSTGVFSVGTSMSASGLSGGQYRFQAMTTGQVNLDFNLVTAGNTVMCYDSSPNLINAIILVQLTSATTLKIERQTAASCGSGPWMFTSNASNFVR